MFCRKGALYRACTLLKKKLRHRCFHVNFVKFLKNTFFYRTLPVVISIFRCSYFLAIIQCGCSYDICSNKTKRVYINIVSNIGGKKPRHFVLDNNIESDLDVVYKFLENQPSIEQIKGNLPNNIISELPLKTKWP